MLCLPKSGIRNFTVLFKIALESDEPAIHPRRPSGSIAIAARGGLTSINRNMGLRLRTGSTIPVMARATLRRHAGMRQLALLGTRLAGESLPQRCQARLLPIYPEVSQSLESLFEEAQHSATAGADPSGFVPRRESRPDRFRR